MSIYDDVEKIDAHMHYNCRRPALLEAARAERFRLVSINTEVPFFPSPGEQAAIIRDLNQHDETVISHLTTFTTVNWGAGGWPDQAIGQITSGMEQGAVGVKVWKNIGMELKDEDGDFVMIDHPSFDPVFEYCTSRDIPVLGHLGEPRNCWLPVSEMTVQGDRDYFETHPEYHMYRHPEYPSYEQQLAARDRRLRKHPDLRFIGAHLASLEWSVDRLADWLDRFPNAVVDLAERICHLQYQAVEEWEKVRNFVIEYQDRILYGTDLIDDETVSAEKVRSRIIRKWHMHWQFFATGDMMSVYKVEKPFKALNLESSVLKKIFRENALRWYPGLKTG
ncbi:MAG: amidohydrolase family protein [Balneolaceae bacterium]|nr:amidohydrolase family protein [Balneolaceae bacterium]